MDRFICLRNFVSKKVDKIKPTFALQESMVLWSIASLKLFRQMDYNTVARVSSLLQERIKHSAVHGGLTY